MAKDVDKIAMICTLKYGTGASKVGLDWQSAQIHTRIAYDIVYFLWVRIPELEHSLKLNAERWKQYKAVFIDE